ncbi:MAG TPA: EAL domain-containing protein [Candidatus Limnocylindrales bacterium]
METTAPDAPVLIVDDDAAARELVATQLRREGFETREAASGEAALRLIAAEAIGLVILDMRMPGISGTDVILALREQPDTATLPIMVLTGKGDEYSLAASLGVGADDYLTKPIRLDELVARVRAHLRGVRVAAEQAMRESEERYRALVEQSADGILVSDQTRRYVVANPAICRMLGYTRDELLSMYSPGLSAHDDPVSPEEMDERLAATVAGTGLLVQRRYRRSDGSSLSAEVSFSQLPDGRLQRNIRDIGERLAADAERTRLASAVEQTADAIWMNDLAGIITYVNPAFTRAYGYTSDEVVGLYAGILDSGQHEPAFFSAIWAAVHAGRTWTGTIVNRRKDGTPIEMESVVSAIHDADGRLTGYVQADRDVTHERKLEGALARDARERETIEAALAQIDPDASAEEIATAACAVINGLPGVDSTMAVILDEGEGAVLAVAGQLVPTFVPRIGLPAGRVEYLRERASGGPWYEEWRPGPGAGAWEDAITTTGLRATAYAPLRGPRGVIGVVGIASHETATAPALVEHMPALAAFASILGALLVPKLQDRRRESAQRAQIRGVLEASAFAPFFQPIVELHTGSVVGYEALTRFTDGVPPDIRFAAAARAGLGIELELATLRAAMSAGAAVLSPTAFLSLNASPGLITSGALRALFAGVARPLVLEITEHVAIVDYVALRAELAALGPTVRVAVDDAGAGYASFHHILELAPDLVKLDIGLIRGIDADPARQALLAGMAYFAVRRKIRLVAEGIETGEELEVLRSLAVPYGQGYLLGRPRDGREPGPWPTAVTLATRPAKARRSRARR